MSAEIMRICDILKYSIKIENESRKFYHEAALNVIEEEVKKLVLELEKEEVRHGERLSEILSRTEDSDAVDFDRESLKKLIQNKEIPSDSDEIDVLRIALEREEHTRNFYSSVSTATNLDANIVDLFQMLYDQERGHVAKISKMLEKLKK